MISVRLLTFEKILPLRVLLFERLFLLLLIPVTIKLYFSVKHTIRNTTVPIQEVLRIGGWNQCFQLLSDWYNDPNLNFFFFEIENFRGHSLDFREGKNFC